VPLESVPAPLFRLLQITERGATTGYYGAGSGESVSFVSMSPLGKPEECVPTAESGWAGIMLAAPMSTLDLSVFPGPFSVE
jgi:hypothetical protein